MTTPNLVQNSKVDQEKFTVIENAKFGLCYGSYDYVDERYTYLYLEFTSNYMVK